MSGDINIKEMVRDNKLARFVKYQAGNLWYETESGFQFPVPIEDLGGVTVNREERALLLMSHIRRHVEFHIRRHAEFHKQARATK